MYMCVCTLCLDGEFVICVYALIRMHGNKRHVYVGILCIRVFCAQTEMQDSNSVYPCVGVRWSVVCGHCASRHGLLVMDTGSVL